MYYGQCQGQLIHWSFISVLKENVDIFYGLGLGLDSLTHFGFRWNYFRCYAISFSCLAVIILSSNVMDMDACARTTICSFTRSLVKHYLQDAVCSALLFYI